MSWKPFGERTVIRGAGSQAAVFQQVYGKSLTQVQADLEQYWRGTPGHRGARSRPATNVLCNEIQAYLAGIQQQ